jgi:hypothetical protein
MTIGIGFCFLIEQKNFFFGFEAKKNSSGNKMFYICMDLLFGLWVMMLGQDEYLWKVVNY